MTSRSPLLLALLAGFLAAVAAPPAALAASGDLDPSFGSGGTTLTDFGGGNDEAAGVVIDAGGRIIAAGTGVIGGSERTGQTGFSLARHLPDGSLDPAFGGDGLVQTGFGDSDAVLDSVDLDPQGRIVVTGHLNDFLETDFLLARYLGDGSLDPAFGDGGRVLTGLSAGRPADAAVDARGGIIVAGESGTGRGLLPTVARYLPSGALDPAFSGDGIRRIRSKRALRLNAVALDPAGRILLAGDTTSLIRQLSRFTAIRLLPSGSTDTTFARGGRRNLFPGNQATGTAVVGDDRGGLIVAGSCRCGRGDRPEFAVAALSATGASRQSFGRRGHARVDFGRTANATSLALDPAGRVVIGGDSSRTSLRGGGLRLARLTPLGAPDRGFSGDGEVSSVGGVSPGTGGIRSMAVDESTGAILTVTTLAGASGTDFALRRYLP